MDTNFLKEINLYVRYVNYLKGCDNNTHHLNWRHIYDYEIIYVVKGEMIVETSDGKYTVKANQLHIMPPFLKHTRYFPDNKVCDYYNTHIDFFYEPNDEDFSVDDVYIKPIWENYNLIETVSLAKRKRFEGIKVVPLIDIHDTKTLENCFSSLNLVFKENKSPYKLIELKSKSYELLFHILKECEKNGVSFMSYNKNIHEDIVSDFIKLIETHYMDNFDLNQIADNYGLSKNYFSKLFHKSKNIAPYDYIITYRIEKSKQLLLSGKYLINEVANMVGYDNVHYFSRLFKLKEGVSPLNYLKRIT